MKKKILAIIKEEIAQTKELLKIAHWSLPMDTRMERRVEEPRMSSEKR